MEFNVLFQHKYGCIRDEFIPSNKKTRPIDFRAGSTRTISSLQNITLERAQLRNDNRSVEMWLLTANVMLKVGCTRHARRRIRGRSRAEKERRPSKCSWRRRRLRDAARTALTHRYHAHANARVINRRRIFPASAAAPPMRQPITDVSRRVACARGMFTPRTPADSCISARAARIKG